MIKSSNSRSLSSASVEPSSSSNFNLECASGLRYIGSQKISQIKPNAPVAINAHCHPSVRVIPVTITGAVIAPIVDPELKSPAAKALSFLGNYSATVFTAAGKLAASPIPNTNRAAAKLATPRATA